MSYWIDSGINTTTTTTTNATSDVVTILYSTTSTYESWQGANGVSEKRTFSEELHIDVGEVETECDIYREIALASICARLARLHLHTLRNVSGDWWDLNTYGPNTINMARQELDMLYPLIEEGYTPHA